jgi:hypothetical protein
VRYQVVRLITLSLPETVSLGRFLGLAGGVLYGRFAGACATGRGGDGIPAASHSGGED